MPSLLTRYSHQFYPFLIGFVGQSNAELKAHPLRVLGLVRCCEDKTKYTLRRMRSCSKSGTICLDRFLANLVEREMGEFVAVFYCTCRGRKRFWAEFWWKSDEGKHGWTFFDDQEKSASYGERVTTCSGCGERLDRRMLTPA